MRAPRLKFLSRDSALREEAKPLEQNQKAYSNKGESVPLAWPWSEYKAELPRSVNSRRRRKNAHPTQSVSRRPQLPLTPKRRDWERIISAASTVCALVALGALELHFRYLAEPAQTGQTPMTQRPPLMQEAPAEQGAGQNTGTPPVRQEKPPQRSAEPAPIGASPMNPGALTAEPRPPAAAATKHARKNPRHIDKRRKKRAADAELR